MNRNQIINLIQVAVANQQPPSYFSYTGNKEKIKYQIPDLDVYFEAFPHIDRPRTLHQLAVQNLLDTDTKTLKVLIKQKF